HYLLCSLFNVPATTYTYTPFPTRRSSDLDLCPDHPHDQLHGDLPRCGLIDPHVRHCRRGDRVVAWPEIKLEREKLKTKSLKLEGRRRASFHVYKVASAMGLSHFSQRRGARACAISIQKAINSFLR